MSTELIQAIRAQSKLSISQAISLVENCGEIGKDILAKIYKFTGQAYRIGITGPPGAGKSSLTDQLISAFREKNKKVAVIGSGATAVTLIPEIAKKASHVTMIQRSPTYIASVPSEYKFLHLLNYISPKLGYKIIRFTNILRQRRIFKRARRSPKLVKDYILGLVRKELPNFDIEKQKTSINKESIKLKYD